MTTYTSIETQVDSFGEVIYSFDPTQGQVKSGRFHCTTPGHNKWWEFVWDGIDTMETRYGRLDQPNFQTTSKPSTASEVRKLVIAKLKKGYVQVTVPGDDSELARERQYQIEDLMEWLSEQDDEWAQKVVRSYDSGEQPTPQQIIQATNMRQAQAQDD